MADAAREIGKRWAGMSAAQKKNWNEKAAADKIRYESEMQAPAKAAAAARAAPASKAAEGSGLVSKSIEVEFDDPDGGEKVWYKGLVKKFDSAKKRWWIVWEDGGEDEWISSLKEGEYRLVEQLNQPPESKAQPSHPSMTERAMSALGFSSPGAKTAADLPVGDGDGDDTAGPPMRRTSKRRQGSDDDSPSASAKATYEPKTKEKKAKSEESAAGATKTIKMICSWDRSNQPEDSEEVDIMIADGKGTELHFIGGFKARPCKLPDGTGQLKLTQFDTRKVEGIEQAQGAVGTFLTREVGRSGQYAGYSIIIESVRVPKAWTEQFGLKR